jgi:catechol 2,3-dioxygenase-like lactoylglutathione lyase family enzyme
MLQQRALRGHLLYVELGSPAPERLARFYADIFNMSAIPTPRGWICRGPDRCVVISDGPPRSLLSAGYALTDPSALDALAKRAAENLIHVGETGAPMYEPGAIALRDPDNNRLIFGIASPSTAIMPADSPHARLQHVVVGSTDVARLAAFYAEDVGFLKSDEVFDDEGGLRTCFLRSDDEHHSFAVFRTASKALDHHCYELPSWNDIRDWGDRLARCGVTVKWGPGRHGPGNNLFLFFHDPDNNWVELSTELEVVADPRPTGRWRHEERTLNSWGHAHLRS